MSYVLLELCYKGVRHIYGAYLISCYGAYLISCLDTYGVIC
jgi:hypothetical protein